MCTKGKQKTLILRNRSSVFSCIFGENMNVGNMNLETFGTEHIDRQSQRTSMDFLILFVAKLSRQLNFNCNECRYFFYLLTK